jgi:hypothetical protein
MQKSQWKKDIEKAQMKKQMNFLQALLAITLLIVGMSFVYNVTTDSVHALCAITS